MKWRVGAPRPPDAGGIRGRREGGRTHRRRGRWPEPAAKMRCPEQGQSRRRLASVPAKLLNLGERRGHLLPLEVRL